MKRHLKTKMILLAAILVLSVAGCDSMLPEFHANSPVGNFEALWGDLDEHYALFDVRQIDWDAVYDRYRPRVHDGMTDEELAAVMCEMLEELEDGHIFLAAEGQDYCRSDAPTDMLYFPDGQPDNHLDEFHDQVRVVSQRYLDYDTTGGRGYQGGWILWGVPQETEVGYLNIFRFDDDVEWEGVEALIREMEEADAMVIDVRKNPGGMAKNVQRVLGLISDRARPYLSYMLKDGPGHDDFTGPYHDEMTQGLPGFRDKPVVVLNDHYSGSGAEWFTLGARLMPHVTVVGDTTRGILSGQFRRILPNGWEYSSSGMLVRDMDGVCWEGVGIPPDVRARNTRAANLEGRDVALDEALRILLGQLGLEP